MLSSILRNSNNFNFQSFLGTLNFNKVIEETVFPERKVQVQTDFLYFLYWISWAAWLSKYKCNAAFATRQILSDQTYDRVNCL